MKINSLISVFQASNYFQRGEILIIGVSGGLDSVVLLHLFLQVREAYALRLHVATLDHGLRSGSTEDADFVEHLAQAWDVPVTCERREVGVLARQQGLSVEAAARQVRYQFFADVAHAQGAKTVAVAHHANDQAETVLMRLLRGSGPYGLRGMGERVPLPGAAGLILLRPLLQFSRDELRQYCQENDLPYRDDPSNADTAYTRNAIRHDVLPLLEEKMNPNLVEALNRLAGIISVEQDFIDQALMRAVQNEMIHVEGRITLPRACFRNLHMALQRRFIHYAVTQLNVPELRFDQVENAVRLACTGEVGNLLPFPGDVRLRVDYDVIAIEDVYLPLPIDPHILLIEPGSSIELQLPGVTQVPGGDWSIKFAAGRVGDHLVKVPENSHVMLRTRLPGDRFDPPGLSGHTQKLKDWMINRKVPRHLREQLPLITVNGQIAVVIDGGSIIVTHKFQPNANEQDQVFSLFFIMNSQM